MNQEFIDAYPQGLALSPTQRLLVNQDSLPLYHQVELKFEHLHPADKVQQLLAKICEEHFCLTAVFKTVQGYRGVRQFPASTKSKLSFEHVDSAEPSVHAQLLSAHPVNISLDLGINLHATLVNQADWFA
jgi:hypothetical protein